MSILSYVLLAVVGVLSISCVVLFIIKKVKDNKRKGITKNDRSNK